MKNPFTDAYWQQELEFYGQPPKPEPPVMLDYIRIRGDCDDYLNVNKRFEDARLPRLRINGHLWMSLTPMEVQSAALSIALASGRVVLGGLGLGYVALRVAAKSKVTRVTVYEMEPKVVDWFQAAFQGRPGFKKIEFVLGDMRQTCRGAKADFAYVDIYDELLPEEVVTDSELFQKANQFKSYVYWGFERVWRDAIYYHKLISPDFPVPTPLAQYLRQWSRTCPVSCHAPRNREFAKKALVAANLDGVV